MSNTLDLVGEDLKQV